MTIVELQIPLGEAFEIAKRALDILDIEYGFDSINREINAFRGFSLFSWGEEIQISFDYKNPITIIRIESISPGQLISWGKNERNEENIASTIRNIYQSK